MASRYLKYEPTACVQMQLIVHPAFEHTLPAPKAPQAPRSWQFCDSLPITHPLRAQLPLQIPLGGTAHSEVEAVRAHSDEHRTVSDYMQHAQTQSPAHPAAADVMPGSSTASQRPQPDSVAPIESHSGGQARVPGPSAVETMSTNRSNASCRKRKAHEAWSPELRDRTQQGPGGRGAGQDIDEDIDMDEPGEDESGAVPSKRPCVGPASTACGSPWRLHHLSAPPAHQLASILI
jgi:hypothetical protein